MKYIYIDDDLQSNGKIIGLIKKGILEIETMQPLESWETQMKFLKEQDYDGIILDLRLDDVCVANNKRVSFRGTALAQEIRTLQKEGKIHSFPIVLFSANDNLSSSLDSVSRDLFDLIISKAEVSVEQLKQYSSQIKSITDGYSKFLEDHTTNKILGLDTDFLDARFVGDFTKMTNEPAHVFMQFMINECIEKSGLLIDELTLAARLGVNIKESNDWNTVLSVLKPFQFSGVLSEGWERWWMPLIDKWWLENISPNYYLRSSSAENRVSLLKDKLQLTAIVPAQKIEKATSSDFWTVCKGYNMPLDPIDGLTISGQERLYAWQDLSYVSIDAALKRQNISRWHSVSSVDFDYFESLKKKYSKKTEQI